VTRSDLVAAIEDVISTGEWPAEPPGSVLPAPAAQRPECARRLRVLLAEDNAINQTVVLRMLERLGHEVVVADSGRAALAALDAHAVDLVLMDVEIPDLNGLEVTAAIRAAEDGARAGTLEPGPASTYAAHRGRRIPIVALTAHAMRGSAERCRAAGMDAFLAKPFKGQDLAALMTRLTEDTAGQEAGRAAG
jgi:CheY-like chemotaxis protein